MAAHLSREERGTSSRVTDRALLAALLLAMLAIVWAKWEPYTYLHGDGTFYANINKSLANDASLDQSAYHPHSWLEDDLGWNKNLDQGWSNVSLGADGRWLPKHSWVLPLFSTPFYVLFGLPGLLAFHVLMMALVLLAGYHVAATFLPRGVAAAATLLVATQPIISGDIYSYNNDAFYSAFLLAGTWAYLRGRLPVAGLLFGVAVWAKLTNVLYVAPFAVHLLWQRDPRAIGRALGTFMIPIAVFLGSNWMLFGGPLTTSYDRILVREDGQLTTEGISERFEEPMKEGLKRVLTDEGQGLIPRVPLLVLAIPGAFLLLVRRETRALGASFLVIGAAFLLLHAKYFYTYARFFLPVAGLSILPLGALLAALGGPRIAALGRLLRPRVDGSLNPAFLGALVLGGSVLAWLSGLALPDRAPHYRLSDHIEDARLTQGNTRCDYFNNIHQKFECPGDPGDDFYWGRSLGEGQCVFGEEPQTMLWLHPPRRGRDRTLTFTDVPAGRLVLRYGLAETSKHADVRFEVRVNDVEVPLPKITEIGALHRHEHPAAQDTNTVSITVHRPTDWRHLCLDGDVLDQ